MEYIFWMVFSEYFFHILLVANTCYDCMTLYVRPFLGHHQSYVMLWGLSLVNQNKASRGKFGNLPYHLTANAASRACDEDGLAIEIVGDGVSVNHNLLSWEQFLYIHLVKHVSVCDGRHTIPFKFFGHHKELDAIVCE